MYVHPMVGEDHGLIRVLEGKLAKLTQRVPTLRIDHIPAVMQELVVGIPPVWIRLMKWVARAVLVYIDAVEAVAAEEGEEAREQGDQDDQGDQGGPGDQGGHDDQGGQAQTQEHFMDFDPFFVYYTVMIGCVKCQSKR